MNEHEKNLYIDQDETVEESSRALAQRLALPKSMTNLTLSVVTAISTALAACGPAPTAPKPTPKPSVTPIVSYIPKPTPTPSATVTPSTTPTPTPTPSATPIIAPTAGPQLPHVELENTDPLVFSLGGTLILRFKELYDLDFNGTRDIPTNTFRHKGNGQTFIVPLSARQAADKTILVNTSDTATDFYKFLQRLSVTNNYTEFALDFTAPNGQKVGGADVRMFTNSSSSGGGGGGGGHTPTPTPVPTATPAFTENPGVNPPSGQFKPGSTVTITGDFDNNNDSIVDNDTMTLGGITITPDTLNTTTATFNGSSASILNAINQILASNPTLDVVSVPLVITNPGGRTTTITVEVARPYDFSFGSLSGNGTFTLGDTISISNSLGAIVGSTLTLRLTYSGGGTGTVNLVVNGSTATGTLPANLTTGTVTHIDVLNSTGAELDETNSNITINAPTNQPPAVLNENGDNIADTVSTTVVPLTGPDAIDSKVVRLKAQSTGTYTIAFDADITQGNPTASLRLESLPGRPVLQDGESQTVMLATGEEVTVVFNAATGSTVENNIIQGNLTFSYSTQQATTGHKSMFMLF